MEFILIVWLSTSVIVGFIGRNRKIGFMKAFLISLLLSPLFGIIFSFATMSIEDYEYRKNLLDIQKQQNDILNKISENLLTSTSNTSNAQVDKTDELAKLNAKKKVGIISEEEYDELKNKLLNPL